MAREAKKREKDLTIEGILASLDKISKENDRIIKENEKARKESEKKWERIEKEHDKIWKDHEKIWKEHEKIWKSLKIHDHYIDNQSRNLEEAYFEAILDEIDRNGYIKINGHKFIDAAINFKIGSKKKRKEVDIILFNEDFSNVFVIEVKQRLNHNDIDKLKEVVSYLQKDYFFSKAKIVLLGFAVDNISKDLKEKLLQEGFIVLTSPKKLKFDYKEVKSF
jgi:hypothetical protein